MLETKTVAPGPEGFYQMCPGEVWSIWVHKQVKYFEWDSYGASAGFMEEGTVVQILKRWPNIVLKKGPMVGEAIAMVKVRGIAEHGKQITGWAMERDFI